MMSEYPSFSGGSHSNMTSHDETCEITGRPGWEGVSVNKQVTQRKWNKKVLIPHLIIKMWTSSFIHLYKYIMYSYPQPWFLHKLKISLSCFWLCICIYHHHMPWLRWWQGRQFRSLRVKSSFFFRQRWVPRSGTRRHRVWRNWSHDRREWWCRQACSRCRVVWW